MLKHWWTLLSALQCHAWQFHDSASCWTNDAERDGCCGPPAIASCFDAVYTAELCCSSRSPADALEGSARCLPLDATQSQVVLRLSAGLETFRLSLAARPVACMGIAWQNWYVVLRTGPISWTVGASARTAAEKAVRSTRPNHARHLSPSLRSLLLCAPAECGNHNHEVEKLAVFVAEQTLPSYHRPASLMSAEVLAVDMLESITSKIGAPNRADCAVAAGLDSVPCYSGACVNLGLDHLQSQGAVVPKGAIVVIDIGAGERSEFVDRLQAGQDDRLWVIGFEPNPNLTASHSTNTHLAIIEAAVGCPDKTGYADFHLTTTNWCSSLLPLSTVAQTTHMKSHSKVKALVRQCLTLADSEPVKVRVVPLAALLRLLPDGQQIAFLKIDAQGGDLAAVVSAGPELQRVRRLQIEVMDYPPGDQRMPYAGQPSKLDIINELSSRGFVLEACRGQTFEFREENCLFVRSDVLAEEAPVGVEDLVYGDIRWDRPPTPGHGSE